MTTEFPQHRNYWLDCLRGYAILLVCISHAFHIQPIASVEPQLKEMRIGYMGVHIFYFISGFLVVRILADELRNDARSIDRILALRNFWVRRIWRLQPGLIAFLLAYFTFAYDPGDHLPLWSLIFPISNLLDGPYYTWHLKTLHLEEAFYILAGLALLAFSRNRVTLFLVVILLFVALRVAKPLVARWGWVFDDGWMSYVTAFEPMLWGGIMGLHRERISKSRVAQLIRRRGNIVFITMISAMLLSGIFFTVKPFSYIIFWSWPTLWSGATAAMIIALDGRKTYFANPPVHYIGIISYTLYLFQQFALSSTQTFSEFQWIKFFLVSCLVIVFVACWSRLVEAPLTQYGARRFPRLRQPSKQASISTTQITSDSPLNQTP